MKKSDIHQPVGRAIHWVSAVDPANAKVLAELQARMAGYYATNDEYYEEIDITKDYWRTEPSYAEILHQAERANRILEIGCGRANLLAHAPGLAARYTGIDFSSQLIERNRKHYSEACFQLIEWPTRFPVESSSYDFVFSVWVIEHTVYPNVFLDECCRVLRPGGVLAILCPDYLGADRMASQRAGFSAGTGKEKVKRGAILDALVTGWDRKVVIPGACGRRRKAIGDRYAFLVNSQPVCFTDPFIPDVDAVYVTYADEMIAYLRGRVGLEPSAAARAKDRQILLLGKKGN
jgi:SAM-dependent methyltransferase